jgi:hypothetical protein
LRKDTMLELFDTLDVIENALRESHDPERMVELLRQERQRVLKNIENAEQEMFAQEQESQL